MKQAMKQAIWGFALGGQFGIIFLGGLIALSGGTIQNYIPFGLYIAVVGLYGILALLHQGRTARA